MVAKKLNHKSMVARLLGIGIGWAVCLSVLFSCCKFTFKSNQINLFRKRQSRNVVTLLQISKCPHILQTVILLADQPGLPV